MKDHIVVKILGLSLIVLLSGCGAQENANSSETSEPTPNTTVEETAIPDETGPTDTTVSISELDETANPANFTVTQLSEMPEFEDDELAFSVDNDFNNEDQYVNRWAKITGVEVWDADEENLTFTSGIVEYSFTNEENFTKGFETALQNHAEIIGYITNNGATYDVVNCICVGSDPGEAPDLIDEETDSGDSGITVIDHSVTALQTTGDDMIANARGYYNAYGPNQLYYVTGIINDITVNNGIQMRIGFAFGALEGVCMTFIPLDGSDVMVSDLTSIKGSFNVYGYIVMNLFDTPEFHVIMVEE